MKKRILLFTAIAAFGYVSLTSYQSGPAGSSQNRSGAKGSSNTCGASGCHGTAAGPTVTITVDSGSTTGITKYTLGKTYKIKIHGAGTTNPKFGFQFASVSGSGSSQVQAGTASTLPPNVASHSFSSLSFIEQTTALAGTSAGVYDVQFDWTAPSTPVGNITLYCTINAVDGGGGADAGDKSGNTSIVLSASTLAVPTVAANFTAKAFPNPVSSNLNLEIAEVGNYAVSVYDLNGRNVANEQISVAGASQVTSINAGNWATGMYQVVLTKEDTRQVISVIKQ